MRTFRSLIVAAFALGLCSSVACKKETPDGTNPPEDGDATADAGGKKGRKGKKGKKGKGGDGGDGGGGQEDPTKKVCPAENSEVPSTVFAESALLKLPKGVEAMVEQNPFYASMNPSQVESVSCVEGVPGAMITHGSMGYFEDDQKRGMEEMAKETLGQLYGELDIKMTEQKETGGGDRRSYTVVVDIPPDPQNNQPDPARALVTLKSAYGRMYWLVFETHPNAWNALKNSFYKTSDELLFLDPDAAGG